MAAHAPRVPNLRTNIAFLPKGAEPLADSSYLNRPIVGPTPPKLPAQCSNLRHHRVLPAFAGAFIDYYKHPPKSSVYTKFLQNFCVTLRNLRNAEKQSGKHRFRTAFAVLLCRCLYDQKPGSCFAVNRQAHVLVCRYRESGLFHPSQRVLQVGHIIAQ